MSICICIHIYAHIWIHIQHIYTHVYLHVCVVLSAYSFFIKFKYQILSDTWILDTHICILVTLGHLLLIGQLDHVV